jgi:hypothetical protein
MNVMIEQTLSQIMQDIAASAKRILEAQGHKNTGALEASMRTTVQRTATSVVGELQMYDYAFPLNYGVRPERIPYTPGRSRAKTSKYIQGLKVYFQSKGLSDNSALRAAFATARRHKIEGMPTTASRRFSQTGRRTGFASETLDDTLEKAVDTLTAAGAREVSAQIGKALVFQSFKVL